MPPFFQTQYKASFPSVSRRYLTADQVFLDDDLDEGGEKTRSDVERERYEKQWGRVRNPASLDLSFISEFSCRARPIGSSAPVHFSAVKKH